MTTLEINNPVIEKFLKTQAKMKKVNVSEYLVDMINYEIEKKSVEKDVKQIKKEIKLANDWKIKLKDANLLLKELDD